MGIEMECSYGVPRDTWSKPEYNNTETNNNNNNDDI